MLEPRHVGAGRAAEGIGGVRALAKPTGPPSRTFLRFRFSGSPHCAIWASRATTSRGAWTGSRGPATATPAPGTRSPSSARSTASARTRAARRGSCGPQRSAPRRTLVATPLSNYVRHALRSSFLPPGATALSRFLLSQRSWQPQSDRPAPWRRPPTATSEG